MRGLILAAALVAAIVGMDTVGHAAAKPGQSRPRVVSRALEPGFTGTFCYRNDNFRTGQNLAESVLNPSTVTGGQFGLKFTDAIDGAAYAEPLYVPNLTIPGQGTHNVVYVATENDSVYAFDADNQGPPLWHTSFLDKAKGISVVPSSDIGCGDLTPIIGITATPVIDPVTGTLYVISKVKLAAGSYRQQLHALDITTGLERPNSPVTITASVPGTGDGNVGGVLSFDPLLQHDRPALTLANGIVYLTFASHCDFKPYHGWILGYDETTLAQVVVFNTTPNGSDGGIWQSGCGPGVDTNGDLIAITGNGTFDTVASPLDYGDTFLRLTPSAGTLTVSTSFTPLNELVLSDDDLDLGSGGNLLLPDQPGPNPHLMVSAGKTGTIYVVNRDAMGGFNPKGDQVVQELTNPQRIGSLFSTPAYWQGTVPGVGLQNLIYTIAVNDVPKMFVINNGMIQTPPASVTYPVFLFGFPGASPVISANGTTGGILWAIDSAGWQDGDPAVLYAFDATNLKNFLYASNAVASDNPGPAVKFTIPTVANGSVYVGTATKLAVFGLFSTATPSATPTATATPTPTNSATSTLTPSPTATASPTPTTTSAATPTATSTGAATPTTTPTGTVAISPTPTATATATATSTPTITATSTTSAVPTSSPSPVFATLYANPKSISFSAQMVGHMGKSAAVTVLNTSANNVVTMSPPTASTGFVITSDTCPTQLQPGGSCTIGVASMPAAKGKQKGQLQVLSNARYGNRSVLLKGKGLAPKLKSKPKSLSFEPTSPDAVSSSHTIAIVNDSPVPISLTAAPAATPPFNVTSNTCGTLAPNGGRCTISVEFAPHRRGKYAGTLELRDTAGNRRHIKLLGRTK